MVYIGMKLPEEYAHSNYTNTLKGVSAKAKANATQNYERLYMMTPEEVIEILKEEN